MAIRGITFSKQSVSSNDDAHIYKILLNGRKGRTIGCKMTYGTDDIYISEGRFFAANRMIEVSSTETIGTPVITSGTTYCRLVFEIDMSKTNTNTAFEQGYFKILSSTDGYPAITQEDLEDGGDLYQLPFAKFTKTVSGIGSFVSELETIGLSPDNATIYVSKSGNDASGDGSESSPFATIQYAINSMAKNLENRDITINIASGTYAEDIVVSGFYGGTLRFTFGTVTINTFSVYESSIIMTGTNLYMAATGKTYGFYCHRGANVICQLPVSVTGATSGIYCAFGSRFSASRAITVNTCATAVVSIYSSYIYISALEGIQNTSGVQASAAIVSIGSIDSSLATTLYVTQTGGRIFTGAQASVPSY